MARKRQTGSLAWMRFKLMLVLAALGLPGLLNGCAGCQPTPTVDTPASSLAVKITIPDVTATPSDGKVPVIMQFLASGSPVQLAPNATVSANSVVLTWNGLVNGYAERVPIKPPGGTYQFLHVRNAVTSAVTVTVPQRPGIISPTAGASLARSSNLPVTYVPGSGTGVRCGASDPSTGLGGNLQPDTGACSVDVSSLNAGPGSVSVTRELTSTPPSIGFQSATANYSTGASVNVTWL